MLISVCIPCYCSAKMLPAVTDKIKEQFRDRDEKYEIILVNDGSKDNTFEVIRELCDQDENIKGIDLMRNYGQASAKLAALRYARGDMVVLMDDDGQHPAEAMFQLTDKLLEGNYDAVYAHFKNRKHSLLTRFTSYLYNKAAVAIGVKPKGVHTSSYGAYSRVVVDKLKDYHSPFVSFGGYLEHLTTRHGEVDIEHGQRMTGSSGYTLKKRLNMFKNIFFSFSMVPLQIATALGELLSAVGFIGVIYLIIHRILHPDMPAGYTSTNIIILIIGGMILVALGIIGEYVGRIYMTISGMPQSAVRNTVNVENRDK